MPRPTTLRARLARGLAAITVATTMVPAAVLVTGGSVAFAGTCSPGDVDLYTYVGTKSILFTHEFEVVTIPPGGSASHAIGYTTTYTSSVTGEGSAKFQAGAIIASAETTVGFSLKDEYARTSTSTVTVTANNATSGYRDYIFYRGTRKAVGTWKEYHCVVGRETLKYQGTWGSWHLQQSGAVRCDADSALLSQYGSYSLQYQAAIKC